MKPLPIPHQSNPGPFKVNGEPKVVNAYAEAGGDDNKSNFSLIPVAGIKTFGPDSGSGCRGMLYLEDEAFLYTVKGLQVYKVEEDGTSTALGFIGGDGPVFMARNDAEQQEVMISADGNSYEIKNGVLTLKKYTSEAVDGTVTDLAFEGVAYIDGYFVFWRKGLVYASELQSTTVSDLNFNAAGANPDGITCCAGVGKLLYVIGTDTTEHWRVTGDDFPIKPIPGSYFNFGSASPHSVREFDNGLAMVGSDNVVYHVQGVTYKPISSKEIERLLEAETDKASIVAFTHERGGNKFYTLQGTGWTREYNSATASWHDREDTLGNQWHCRHHARAWNRDIYGDTDTGQLFEGDYSIFTDNGKQIPWGFDTQTLHDAPNGLSFDRVELDMETGDGESVTDDGKVMLRWSKNNGRTWTGERQLSLGKTGEYRKRIRTHGIGQCSVKGMVLSVRVTDPVVRAIAGLYGDVKRVVL